jgi:hypothetical protein
MLLTVDPLVTLISSPYFGQCQNEFIRYDHKADLSAGLLEPVSSPFDSLKTWRHCNILRNTDGQKTVNQQCN